jgi:hypothetical protein
MPSCVRTHPRVCSCIVCPEFQKRVYLHIFFLSPAQITRTVENSKPHTGILKAAFPETSHITRRAGNAAGYSVNSNSNPGQSNETHEVMNTDRSRQAKCRPTRDSRRTGLLPRARPPAIPRPSAPRPTAARWQWG